MNCSTPGFTIHHQLPELAHTHVHHVGDAIKSSHPLLPLLLLPSIFPSMRVFSNESVLHIRWPMYWSFSFSISPSNEHSGFISFRIDWFDLLAVQGTQESSPTAQFKSIDSLVLSFLYGPVSNLFMVQVSQIARSKMSSSRGGAYRVMEAWHPNPYLSNPSRALNLGRTGGSRTPNKGFLGWQSGWKSGKGWHFPLLHCMLSGEWWVIDLIVVTGS